MGKMKINSFNFVLVVLDFLSQWCFFKMATVNVVFEILRESFTTEVICYNSNHSQLTQLCQSSMQNLS